MKLIIAQALEIPPFDPAEILGKGWKFNPNDEQSLALAEINLSDICTASMLRGKEKYISGKEARVRLKAESKICLGPAVGWFFFKNPRLIPQGWEKFDRVYFDGDPFLLSPFGYEYAFYLYRCGSGWGWGYSGLGSDRLSSYPSAVLAPSTRS